MSSSVLISEVGPRDGLQSVDAFMPTVEKRHGLVRFMPQVFEKSRSVRLFLLIATATC
jgi:hypothetical protein